MPQNFTVSDIAALSIAFPLFGLLLLIPGYVVGAALDIFAFGKRTLLAKGAIAICLAVAVVPIATYLTWRACAGAACAGAACAACGVACAAACGAGVFACVVTLKPGSAAHPGITRPRLIILTILAAWVLLAAFCLIDLQLGNRLYFPLNSYDYTMRAAITSAINRTGIPPANPYFYPGHPYPLHYHYFWYMVCSLVDRFGAPLVTARIAIIAGTLWSGIALVALVALYVHFFRTPKPANPERQMLVAIALLSVTGLDIVPVAIFLVLAHRLIGSSQWWNEPVLSWVSSVLWQPHSVAALIADLTGFLVVWDASRQTHRRARLFGAAIAGAAFASGLGLSIYVTFVFAIFLLAWLATLLYRGRRRPARLISIAGALSLALSLPYILQLFGEVSGAAKVPITFAIRSFYIVRELVKASPSGHQWKLPLAYALSLPLSYFVEFGFFFVVALRQRKKFRHQKSLRDEDACLVAMLAASILICTFLRSTTISTNDLGWRGMMLAQFVLLIWGAELWDNGLFLARKTLFSGLGVLLALGVATTVYDVTMLRIYPLLLDAFPMPRYHWLAPDRHLGERTYALRQVYEKLARELPKSALVQQNPNGDPGDMFYGLYADRQTAVETLSCGVVLGGPPALCSGILTPVVELFSQSANLDSAQVDQVCRKLSIAALVVKDTDSVWKDQASWVWKKQPLIANAHARAFLCGANPQKSRANP